MLDIVVRIHIFSHSGNTATGTVILKDNGITIATKSLDTNGSAVFILEPNDLGSGIHTLIAFYAGNKKFAPSSSFPIVKHI